VGKVPVLTSSGRGADIMVTMAIPSFGGMLIELMTLFVVPVLFCLIQEIRLRRAMRSNGLRACPGGTHN
jgi:Cu(I)/Ag(I) efflux system membrane protein CusA/SilA